MQTIQQREVHECPPDHLWKEMLSGLVDEPQAASLESHLLSCSTCSNRLDELSTAEGSTVRPRLPLLAEGWLSEPELGELRRRGSEVLQALRYERQSQSTLELPLRKLPPELGPYRLGTLLGRGGMGEVYEAIHSGLNRPVAIKVISARFGEDSQSRRRFCREIVSTGRVVHRNVVAATDTGEVEGHLFLVMELLSGSDIRALCSRGPNSRGPSSRGAQISTADACEIARQAAEGLAAIHASNLVHRDIKPSNLFLTDDGVVKILDLGLAKLALEEEEELTESGVVLGTRSYLAPEQAVAPGEVEPAADVFSLGCVLFKLLGGEGSGRSNGFEGLSAEEASGEIKERLGARSEGIPEPLVALVGRMLSIDPENRPTAEALARELLPPFCAGQRLREISEKTTGATRGRSAASTVTELVEPQVAAKPPARWSRRGMVALGLGGLGMALAATGAYFAGGSGAQEQAFGPNQWNDMLSRPPYPFLWPSSQGNALRGYDPTRQELHITTSGYAMFQLGVAGREGFEIEVSMHQPTWTGGFGVFFGMADVGIPPGRKYEMQTFEFRKYRPIPGDEEFSLNRSFHRFERMPNGFTPFSGRELAAAPTTRPGIHPVNLSLAVEGGRLARCNWEGLPLPNMTNAAVNEFSGPIPPGPFGITAFLTSVTFSRIRAYIHRES